MERTCASTNRIVSSEFSDSTELYILFRLKAFNEGTGLTGAIDLEVRYSYPLEDFCYTSMDHIRN